MASIGSLVLLWQPGLMGKLKLAWSGPYEITWRTNKVNIESQVKGLGRKKKKVVHFHLTKPYHLLITRSLRVILVSEDQDKEEFLPLLSGDVLCKC